ncbi:extensin family protein [Aureimonas jatrophae]|uniref:Uncharacterized conserved protein n=1 Tax=Aureimonas jatrophae TaxID=1166073 RepID=A0A1H0I8B3_9HYPH|nr:extensin family protein [Aureimonas jatrophae]MBB3952030.1 hypothetical protein [Aureimonas jatrophae]SDO27510.1 Uncharacterized conserved protein [Aureimonas jatrophae]
MRGLCATVAALLCCASLSAFAQDVPVPSAPPADASVTAGEGGGQGDAGVTPGLPEAGPVPEARPEPVPGDATGEAPAPAAVPGPSPSAPDVDAAPAAAPAPAYVSPEKARTTPEPGAPETPPIEVTPSESVEAAAAVEDAKACEDELRARGARFEVRPTISDGDCGVLQPVELTKLSNGVTISGKTQFLCRTALALDIWVADGVAPAAAKELGGRTVASLADISTYQCRARASESRISEHSRGSAIDIGAITLSDDHVIRVEAQAPGSAEDRFLADIRRAACGPFRTVLGPGTDSDHGTHLHLDIAARTNEATYCR